MTPEQFLSHNGKVGKLPSLCAHMLMENGYPTMKDVLCSSPKEIMQVPNFGSSCLSVIMEAMASCGLKFGVIPEAQIPENTEMFKMSVGYLKSLGYHVILVKGTTKTY